MSPEDVDTLRSAYENINRGDWDAVFRDAQPDFELKTPDRMMRHGTFRGAETIRQVMEDLLEPFEDVVAEPEEFRDSGDLIVVFLSVRSRPKGSSAVMEIRIAHLWTMRDGKPAQLEIFPEREKALAAAGLKV